MSSQIPVVLVCGISEDAIAQTSSQLQFSLPAAVVVRHHFDPERDVLTRNVFDLSGVNEKDEVFLDGDCVGCTTREDLIHTLQRLASAEKWPAIIAQLPVAIEPIQVHYWMKLEPDIAPNVRIGAITVALAGETLKEDVLGPEYLVDYELPVRDDDLRGTAEVLAEMIESADIVSITGKATKAELDLAQILARPDATVSNDLVIFDEPVLTSNFDASKTEDWQSLTRENHGCFESEHIWTQTFRSDRPFHPQRLMANLEELANWPVRTRGQFWLPTRPDQLCYWNGAGGALSIGSVPRDTGQQPVTSLFVVGSSEGRKEINAAFEASLLTDDELDQRGQLWEEFTDGFEQWLGPIRQLMEA